MTQTLTYGYSSESTRRELSNEYQHDRVSMVFINLCIFVHWTKVASALEGLSVIFEIEIQTLCIRNAKIVISIIYCRIGKVRECVYFANTRKSIALANL